MKKTEVENLLQRHKIDSTILPPTSPTHRPSPQLPADREPDNDKEDALSVLQIRNL